MNINSICIDLPIKLDEIFSINFEGLKKIIEFFQKNNSALFSSIKDFNKRISAFESLKSDIDAIKIKSLNIEKTNEDINNSFSNINKKIISLESKMNEISIKTEENSETLVKEKYLLAKNEENINKLNDYFKENFEAIKEMKDNYYSIKKKVDLYDIKLAELNNKNNEAMDLIRNNSGDINKEKLSLNQQIELINSNINNISNTINNMKKLSEVKNKEYDKHINEILKSLSTNDKKRSSLKSLEFAFMDNNPNNTNNNSFFEEQQILLKTTKSEIEKEKNQFNKIIEKIKKKQKKLKEENNIYRKSISDMQINIDELNKKLYNSINGKNYLNIDNNIGNSINFKKSNLNDFDFITSDKYKTLSDNLQLLSVALNSKPNKEHFESLKRNLENRLKKLEIMQQNTLDMNKANLMELKEQRENVSLKDSKTIEYILVKIQSSVNENLAPLIKELILKYGKNIDISNNLVILELIKNNKKNIEEMSQKLINIIEKKSKLIRDLDQKAENLNDEIIKLIQNNNVNNVKIEKLIKTIEGTSEFDDKEKDINIDILNNGSIKERLSRLSELYYEVRDRIVLLEKKHASFSKEVKEEVKNNLKNETTKIVEQFKNKLSSFTYKFEDELKNKIDQIGLYTFEKRINSKLLYELKEKLDKKELKKTNTALNRKIDTLENKISKTLVDTIIDLQMDEAPLISKKTSRNLEVCASCNQLLMRNTSLNSDSSLSANKTHMNKFKIKNVKYSENNSQIKMIKTGLSPKKYLPEINLNNNKDK